MLHYHSVGGAIGITTKAPEAVAKRQVGVRMGANNDKATFADLNQPVNDSLAIRLVAQNQSADSETNRVTSRQTFIAPSIAFKIDRDKKFVLRFKQSDNEWTDTIGLPNQNASRSGNLTAEGIPKSTLTANT